MSTRRQPESRRPDFIVTKYRGKKEEKKKGPPKKIERKQSRAGGLKIPLIKIEDSSPRQDLFSGTKLQNEKSLAVKEVNYDVPSPDPSPRSSPKPVSKSKPGKQMYLKACRKFRLVPIKSVTEGMKKRQLSCKYISLLERDVEAIALALVGNHFVREILFDHNNLCQMGAEILSDAVMNTDYISHVRISENKLGSEGAMMMCRAVSLNPFIVSLDLSGNNFTEKDAKYFKALLEVSEHLTELNLSHNSFMENGAITICKGLEKNRHLLDLNMSWNHIRLKGAVAFGKALEHNRTLEKLNLAWNGLHMKGARALAEGLIDNTALKDLDVQCNRMSEECLAELLKGLTDNKTLKTLRLGQNHLTSTGAYKVLEHFKSIENTGVSLLDFGNQTVHENFETLLSDILQDRDIQVIYGTVLHPHRKLIPTDDDNDDVTFLLNSNALTVIMECMRLQNFRLVDMLHNLDTDKNAKISINELLHGLIKVNVPLRKDVLLQFLKKIDENGDGQLDFREMRKAQKMHKRQLRSYKQKNVDLEQTEIGRVSKHIRNMMNEKYIKDSTSIGQLSSTNTSPTPSLKSSRDSSPRVVSRERSFQSLQPPDCSPRLIKRDSSPGVILGNISPFSCDSSQFIMTSSMRSSPSSECVSPDLHLAAHRLSQSTPLPPIRVQGC